MLRRILSILGFPIFVAGFIIPCAWLVGQQPEVPAPNPVRARSSPADRNAPGEIREAKPEVFYLRNEKGNLVLVPSFSFEEWERLVKLDVGQNVPRAPQYSFSKEIKLVGHHTGQQIVIDADFAIRLNEQAIRTPGAVEPSPTKPPEARWVRVPLHFKQAALREPPVFRGDGKYFTEFDPNGDGYVVWIFGSDGTEHDISMRFVSQQLGTANERRIDLTVPVSTARLELTVPGDTAVASTTSQTISIIKTERRADVGTTFSIVGASGNFQISWRDSPEPQTNVRSVLDATGSILVKVEGRNRVRADARFRVRPYGQAIHEFRLRLPPGLRYSPDALTATQAEYQVSVLEGDLPDIAAPQRQLLSVRFSRETTTPPEVRIQTVWTRAGNESSHLEVGNFEIENAVRQTGAFEIAAEADLNVRWVELATITRVDAISEASRQQRVFARFEYDAQPCSLRLEITAKTPRVTVEPIYLLDIQSNRLELQATFRYLVEGGKIGRLEFDTTGWNVIRVLPATLVTPDIPFEATGSLSIPLALDLQGKFEVQAFAARELKPEEPTITIDRFPRPQQAKGSASSLVLAPATIVVTLADNVEVELLSEQLRGLVSEPISPDIQLPTRQQTPLVFREQPGAESPSLSARWKTRSRSVAINTHHVFALTSASNRVESRLSYQVDYAAVDHILVEGRRNILSSHAFRAKLNGRSLPVTLIEDDASDGEPSVMVQARIDLQEKRLGAFDVLLEYPISPFALTAGQVIQQTVDLVSPVADPQTVIGSTYLHLTSASNLRAAAVEETWTLLPTGTQSDDNITALEYSANGNPTSVQLEVRAATPGRNGTVVHRAWVQSWLSVAERRDRAVFYVTTNEKRLRVRLPDGVRETDIEVALDRHPFRNPVVAGSELQLELSPSDTQLPHVVEVWCWLKRTPANLGLHSLETIRLLGVDRVDRFNWEVDLPPHEHLLRGPVDLVPEFTWQWSQGIWKRTSHASQRELELWVGASPAKPVPESTNRYLYSALGAPTRIGFITTTRSMIVLMAAGPILVLGLLCIHLRWWSRPWFLVGASTALASLAVIYPDTSMLLGEAAVAGVALVVLARFLRTSPALSVTRRSKNVGSTLARGDSRSLEIHSPGSVIGSSVHRSTTPMAVPVTATDTPS